MSLPQRDPIRSSGKTPEDVSLSSATLPGEVHFTAIYSRHDNMVVPMESARLDGADNVELAEMGHTTLLFSAQAAQAVITALSNSS